MSRDTFRWTVASLAIHVVAVVALILYSGPTFRFVRDVRFLDLSALARGEESREEVELPVIGRPGGRADAQAGRAVGQVDRPTVARPVADSAEVPAAGPPVRPPDGGEGVAGRDSGAAGPLVLGPSYASGRLWVRPLDALARAGAAASPAEGPIDNATHIARVDSVVAAKVRAFLDTLPPDSFAVARPPAWTTEIDGKKWGIDGTWIYLGDLRLPAAVLALLPFPQANYEQNQRAAELQRIREDILNAAWRAESAEQFKRNVRELRERKDREREMKKNQQTRPDSIRT